MRYLTYLSALVLVVAVTFQSCKKDGTLPEETDPMAVIKGIVYAANHDHVIPNAYVYVDANSVRYSTRSLLDGSFSLTVPAGDHVVHIITGRGDIFHTTINVSVAEGETKSLGGDETELDLTGELAYVYGYYDLIQDVITELGYTATQIYPADLYNTTLLEGYDAIFVNCGAEYFYDPLQYANLAQYVTNGGSLYVSDFAIAYVMGNSGVCPKPEGFVPDETLCSSTMGTEGLREDATIAASDLQDFLGLETIDVMYDLGGWEQVSSVDESYWEVLISHPDAGPMLLRTDEFSNDDAGTQGNIYFTTFHNEPAAELTPEVAGVLQFMILNL